MRKSLYSSGSSDQDKIPDFSDHSSEQLSDFSELNKLPQVNDVVLVEFTALPENIMRGRSRNLNTLMKTEIACIHKKHFFELIFPCIEIV